MDSLCTDGTPGTYLICPSTGLCVPPQDFCQEINLYEHMLKQHEYLFIRSKLLMSTFSFAHKVN